MDIWVVGCVNQRRAVGILGRKLNSMSDWSATGSPRFMIDRNSYSLYMAFRRLAGL